MMEWLHVVGNRGLSPIVPILGFWGALIGFIVFLFMQSMLVPE